MKYHKHNLIITTLSPLHIGNGNSLTSIGEYFATNDNIHIVDSEELLELLQEKLSNDYLKTILEDGKQTRAWDFLKDKGIKQPPALKSIHFNAPVGFDTNSNNTLELAIETDGLKYIPGSTLKGALRNLLFVNFITEEKSGLVVSVLSEESTAGSESRSLPPDSGKILA